MRRGRKLYSIRSNRQSFKKVKDQFPIEKYIMCDENRILAPREGQINGNEFTDIQTGISQKMKIIWNKQYIQNHDNY